MRNVFRSFYIPVTNDTAHDLLTFSTGARGRHLRMSTPSLRWILRRSRPLFAYQTQQYVEENLFTGSTGNDRLEYLADMTRSLAVSSKAESQVRRKRVCTGAVRHAFGFKAQVIDAQANLIDGHCGRLAEMRWNLSSVL
jgi:hypothetical protein